MKITIDIPEDKKADIIDAFCTIYNRPETTQNEAGETIPNPVKKGEFALNCLKSYIKEVYVSAKVKPLEDTKKTAIEQTLVEADVITIV